MQAYDAEGRLAHEAVGGVEVVKLSKKASLQNQRFFFVAGPAEDSYKIVEATTTNNDILTLNISNLSVTYDEPVAGVETYFNIVLKLLFIKRWKVVTIISVMVWKC